MPTPTHRMMASMQIRHAYIADRDSAQAWTLSAIRAELQSSASLPAMKAEIENLLDGNARRLRELDTRCTQALNALDARTFPDESAEG